MEKLQLKMRMLNVAVTEKMWDAFDVLINFWKTKGIKDEMGIAGSILSSGVNSQRTDIENLVNRTPEAVEKMKDIRKENRKLGYDSSKININDCFNITI